MMLLLPRAPSPMAVAAAVPACAGSRQRRAPDRSSSSSWLLPLLLLLLLLSPLPQCTSAADAQATVVPCPGKPRCVQLVVDGTITSVPPIFRQAVTNSSVNEIVLAGTRYVLRPSSWTVYSQQQPYKLTRNLTIRASGQEWSVMDFSLIEEKVLLAPGVTVTFKNLVLANVRKLGGSALDFFMGETGSTIIMDDVIRVKPACPMAPDVLRAALSFQRVSKAFPNNSVELVPRFCFNAALGRPDPALQCYNDALHFEHFSVLAAYNDPDKGNQYPGYVLYQENTTRVCENTITPQCLKESNGDEELCMAMLVAETGLAGQSSRSGGAGGGGMGRGSGGAGTWSPGAVAGVALAGGGVCILLLFLACIMRRQLLRVCCGRGQQKKKQCDPEMGFRDECHPSHAVGQSSSHNNITSYNGGAGSRAISQQVTLTTLLGAGSFGRVYKGRWHSSDVAIKIITVRSPEELPRVLREAEVMMQLDHDNIVRAFHASVWNPAEQARALQGKAARDSRDVSGPSTTARRGATAAAAAAGDTAAEPTAPRNQRSAPRRKSSSLQLQSGGASSSVLAAPAAAAAAAAAPAPSVPPPPSSAVVSINQLPTPSSSQEPPVPQPQQHTSSTYFNTDSSQHAGSRWGHASGASGVAAAAASRGSAGLTGWLQMGPPQQQQQQQSQAAGGVSRRSPLSAAPAAAADCASATLDDVSDRGAQQRGSSAEGLSSSQGHASTGATGQAAAAAVSSDEALDVSSSGRLAAAAAAVAGDKQQQHQQQAAGGGGGLRRHLLLGWNGRPSRSTTSTSGGGAGSSTTPHSSSTAGAGGRHSSSLELVPAGSTGTLRGGAAAVSPAAAAAAAATGGGVSSGGAVAIMHAPESPRFAQRNAISTMHTGPGGGGSQRSRRGGSAGSDSGQHALEDAEDPEHKRAQAEQQVWIILELCTGGTLLDAALAGKFKAAAEAPALLADRASDSRKMSMAKLLSRLLDAANGMAYLHSRGVMHGDLKAGNVLLQHSIHGSYGQTAKISDFGLSAVLINGNTHRSTASLGTITHMAPELLRNGHMSPSADVYSFAILMWEVYCGKQAWQGLHYGVVVERVVISEERPPIPDDMPDEFRMLMERCWDRDPAKRPAFKQIVECLELLLDNLGSEDEDDGDHTGGSSSGVHQLLAGRGASAPPATRDHQQLVSPQPAQQQQLPQDALQQQQQQQQYARLSAPPALPGGAVAGLAAAGSAGLAAATLSAHVSPSTPMNFVQQGTFDSGLTPSGGVLLAVVDGVSGGAGPSHHASRGEVVHNSSSSQHVRTSASGTNQHSSSLGGPSKLASVLDENVYLQDL